MEPKVTITTELKIDCYTALYRWVVDDRLCILITGIVDQEIKNLDFVIMIENQKATYISLDEKTDQTTAEGPALIKDSMSVRTIFGDIDRSYISICLLLEI